ncbi:serine hydrolase [Streptomyces sp. NPDC005125]
MAAVLATSSLLAVFTTAAPASASTAGATVGGSKVVCTSGKPGLASRLSHDIAGALNGRQDTSALALYDRITGTTCELRADTHFDSASVVKVTVLGALLRQAEEAHRKLTPQEVKLTTAMITKSDNDATSALWHQIGSAGFKKFLALADMRHTVPGSGGSWGLTQITAGDELRLMQLLTTENSVLTATSRAYALDLMEHVTTGQRWGGTRGIARFGNGARQEWVAAARDRRMAGAQCRRLHRQRSRLRHDCPVERQPHHGLRHRHHRRSCPRHPS